jgi:hypothetical protein
MPSWMLISHNAFELLTTPGRITMLGEVDGNRMRRIYMDGRPHPEDPDLTLHGHSIGHWEGDTLVIDTVGVAPQAYIAISEAVGVPNDGDMHIVERLHLAEPNVPDGDVEDDARLPPLSGPALRDHRRRMRAGRPDPREGSIRQRHFHLPPAEPGRVGAYRQVRK